MKILKWFRPVVLVVLVALIGCTAAPTPTQTGDDMSSAPSSIKSDKARVAVTDETSTDIPELSTGNTAFAVDLYRQLSSQAGNLFFSPYSISVALAMTQAGAAGDTLAQMNQTLHFTLPEERLHAAFNALDQELAGRAKEAIDPEAEGFKLNIANTLWGQQDFAFRQAYLDLLAEYYGAGMQLVDFQNHTEEARQAINDWVANATEQKIKDIVPEGVLNSDTRLALANAIYFNAAWLDPFDAANTADEPFHLADGSETTVKMMHQQDNFGYASGDGYQLVELPYISQSLVMDVIVPEEGNLATFEQALTAEKLAEMLNGIGYTEVNLGLPKFEYESTFDLSNTLVNMGMTAAFDPMSADFSGMAESNSLYLQSVLHKAFIAVDEAGTEAAAATVAIAGLTAAPLEPVTLTIDHPFLFLIRDTQTGAVLFVGRVVNPVG